MSQRAVDRDTLIKSYRYLRVGMFGLIVFLGVAVTIQTAHQGWTPLDSISAYYYTPAQAVFVAVLISLGVCMIVIRGVRDVEDVLLNIAGMLAPIVALVPTSRGDVFEKLVDTCKDHGSNPLLTSDQQGQCFGLDLLQATVRAYVINNVWSLLIVGLLGLVAMIAFAFRDGQFPPKLLIGFAIALAVYLAAALLFIVKEQWFLRHAHYYAAIPMFVCIIGVALANANRLQDDPGQGKSLPKKLLSILKTLFVPRDPYAWIALLMLLTGIGGGIFIATDDYDKAVFFTEAVLIGLFAVFWLIQTGERWDAEHEDLDKEKLRDEKARQVRAAERKLAHNVTPAPPSGARPRPGAST